jgi:XTP/dITP diphosphohydrolase
MEIVLATRNKGKIREIREGLDIPGLTLRSFEEFDEWPQFEETGDTLEENALLKAFTLRNSTGLPALADDSGLEVDILGGKPGVHSSRYGGPEGDAEKNMDRLLAELEGVPPERRKARFVCVIALALPGGEVHMARGECEGAILEARKGEGGFGYDPIFRPARFKKSMAELSLEKKNSISHRGKALGAMKEILVGKLDAGQGQ